jgi:hypothetical protein
MSDLLLYTMVFLFGFCGGAYFMRAWWIDQNKRNHIDNHEED